MIALIYCAKKGPFLHYKKWNGKGGFALSKHRLVFLKCPASKFGSHISMDDYPLNGSICLEGDCEEAFTIKNECSLGTCHGFRPQSISQQEAYERTGKPSLEKLRSYAKGKDLFAYRLSKLSQIEQTGITELYEDEACAKRLTKAPRGYCFAYRKILVPVYREQIDEMGNIIGEGYTDEEETAEKVIVLTVSPEAACECGNGDRDLEIKNFRIRGAGIKYR